MSTAAQNNESNPETVQATAHSIAKLLKVRNGGDPTNTPPSSSAKSPKNDSETSEETDPENLKNKPEVTPGDKGDKGDKGDEAQQRIDEPANDGAQKDYLKVGDKFFSGTGFNQGNFPGTGGKWVASPSPESKDEDITTSYIPLVLENINKGEFDNYLEWIDEMQEKKLRPLFTNPNQLGTPASNYEFFCYHIVPTNGTIAKQANTGLGEVETLLKEHNGRKDEVLACLGSVQPIQSGKEIQSGGEAYDGDEAAENFILNVIRE